MEKCLMPFWVLLGTLVCFTILSPDHFQNYDTYIPLDWKENTWGTRAVAVDQNGNLVKNHCWIPANYVFLSLFLLTIALSFREIPKRAAGRMGLLLVFVFCCFFLVYLCVDQIAWQVSKDKATLDAWIKSKVEARVVIKIFFSTLIIIALTPLFLWRELTLLDQDDPAHTIDIGVIFGIGVLCGSSYSVISDGLLIAMIFIALFGAVAGSFCKMLEIKMVCIGIIAGMLVLSLLGGFFLALSIFKLLFSKTALACISGLLAGVVLAMGVHRVLNRIEIGAYTKARFYACRVVHSVLTTVVLFTLLTLSALGG